MSLPLVVIGDLRAMINLTLKAGLVRVPDVPGLARVLGALDHEEQQVKEALEAERAKGLKPAIQE